MITGIHPRLNPCNAKVSEEETSENGMCAVGNNGIEGGDQNDEGSK